MEFSFKDTYRAMIEYQSNGKNTVIYDDYGNPNIMYVIPKQNLSQFDLGQVRAGESGELHPAFLFHGKEVNEIFIGKYEASMIGTSGGVPISQFGIHPADRIAYKDMVQKTFKKGRGWHMMQNAEWALLYHQVNTMQFCPDGNKNRGHGMNNKYFGKLDPLSDINRNIESVTRGYEWEEQLILTGTGPKEFYHDGTFSGISDLIGNTWCTCGGAKVIQSRLYFAGEDGAMMNNWDIDDSSNPSDTNGYIYSGVGFDADCNFAADPPLVTEPYSDNIGCLCKSGIGVSATAKPDPETMRQLAIAGMLRHDWEPLQCVWVARNGAHHIARGDRVGSKATNSMSNFHFSTDESRDFYSYHGFRVCYMNV